MLLLCVRTLPGAYLRVERTVALWMLTCICGMCLKMKSAGAVWIWEHTCMCEYLLPITLLLPPFPSLTLPPSSDTYRPSPTV